MSLTPEEIQKTLSLSMMSMQAQMDTERDSFKKRIQKLEEAIEEKDKEISALKESLVDKKKDNEMTNIIISKLNTQIREKDKILEDKIKELQNEVMENGTLKNQVEIRDQEIMQLKLDKKKLNEEWEEKSNILKNQIYSLNKKIEEKDEEKKKVEEEIKEKEKIISEKNTEIEDLKEKMKKLNDSYKDSIVYVKEMKEKEEILKKEKEEMKKERDKLNQEIIDKKKMEKKIEKEKNEKLRQERRDSKTKLAIFEGQEKIITDLLCEFLLKLNNSQYFISVFDLLNKSCKQYDELKFFNKLNSSRHESMNDVIFNFFDSVKSYFSIAQEKATLNDFLQQKSFKMAQIEKEDIEIIKKINSIKLDKNVSILDLYVKKKELFFKSKEFTFNLLKEKILIDQENDKFIKHYGKKNVVDNSQFEFLNIVTPPLELEVNFDELLKQ